jgi:hypothetical protein
MIYRKEGGTMRQTVVRGAIAIAVIAMILVVGVATQGRETLAQIRLGPHHLPFLLLGWIMVAWIPILSVFGRVTGWRRLAGRYPATPARDGRRFRCGTLIMGFSNYRGTARLTADVSHLHFSMMALFRPGHPTFSVPWSDVAVARDAWPWFPLKGHPMIRLTLAADPALRILIPVPVGEGLVAARHEAR